MIDVAALRKLAEAATPGPWEDGVTSIDQLTDGGHGYPLDFYPDSKTIAWSKCESCGSTDMAIRGPDAAFIAACSPDVVVALIDEIERLLTRQRELLATIVRVANETPLPDEIKGWESQRAAMIAEVGTLRSQVAPNLAEIHRLDGELARLRPVYEAAKVWCHIGSEARADGEDVAIERRLVDAVRAAEAKEAARG